MKPCLKLITTLVNYNSDKVLLKEINNFKNLDLFLWISIQSKYKLAQ